MPTPRLTHPTVLVLYAIAHGHPYGFDVIDATGLGSGTVYPILRRLQRAGLLRATRERARDAYAAGRPPRRYYELTGAGAGALREALARHPGIAALLAGASATTLRPRPA
ncbi:MAG TPA: PadR family transcriptional regulator [Gemmatimonadaceae bacterium]